jgi:SNW domain-containing protein 1
MSLSAVLPKPKHSEKVVKSKWAVDEPVVKKSNVPKYLCRKDFIPQAKKDFYDGGAFPEINILQYPLDMGRKKDAGAETSSTIPLQTDKDGNIRYDLVLAQGENNKSVNKYIHATLQDLQGRDDSMEQRPIGDEIVEITQKTQEKLDKMLNGMYINLYQIPYGTLFRWISFDLTILN